MPRVINQTLVALLLVTFCQTVSADEKAPNWEAVSQRWKERSAKMPSLRAKYSVTTFQIAGTGTGQSLNNVKPDGTLFQPKDLKLQTEITFLADRERWRWESRGPVWEGFFEEVVKRERVNVFDGSQLVRYDLVEGKPSLERRCGWISPSKSRGIWMQMPQLIPWMLLYHPFEPSCSVLDSDEWEPTGALLKVRGDNDEIWLGQKFQRKVDPENVVEVVVDPARDFVMRRFVRALLREEIQYRNYPGQGWLPESWTSTEYKEDGTTIRIQLIHKMISLEPGIVMTARDFQVSFPPGTVVTDTLEGRQAMEWFYVRRDGTRRDIEKSERRKFDYSRMETTDPPGKPAAKKAGDPAKRSSAPGG